MNYRIYWDGDAQDELFDGRYNKDNGIATPQITKWNGSSIASLRELGTSYGSPQTCNTTKATPSLQADLLGDWREELVMWNYDDPSKIMIYTTTTATTLRVPTLMHDHTYRMAVCWQNTAYNQPPHLGYHLQDYVDGKLISGIHDAQPSTLHLQPSTCYDLQGRRVSDVSSRKGIVILRGENQVRKQVIK